MLAIVGHVPTKMLQHRSQTWPQAKRRALDVLSSERLEGNQGWDEADRQNKDTTAEFGGSSTTRC